MIRQRARKKRAGKENRGVRDMQAGRERKKKNKGEGKLEEKGEISTGLETLQLYGI